MANFAVHVLEKAGFRKTIEKGSLTAHFFSVTVYEARGVTLPDGFVQTQRSHVAGSDYRIAFAQRINAGCQSLIGNDFTGSESDWQEMVESKGPFVLVAVELPEMIECEAGKMMFMEDGSIQTYDSFPSIRDRLKQLDNRVLPPVLSSVTIVLNNSGHKVALRKLDQACIGQTSDGTMIRDISFGTHGELTAIRALGEEQAVKDLEASVERAQKIHPDVAKYFALGADEADHLKKFVFFFLSLEIKTLKDFDKIKHPFNLLCNDTIALHPSIAELINRDIVNWTNLFDMFVLCATCVWTNLTEDDIKIFKNLKTTRNSIAHGRMSEPPPEEVRQAELLAHKILFHLDTSEL